MLHLEGGDAVRGEQQFHTTQKIVDVRNVSKHIVSRNQVSGPTLGQQFPGVVSAEKFNARFDAFRPAGQCNAFAWFDA